MVYILLGTGFEETEAIAPCDLLRRAGVETKFVGLNGPVIEGSHGIRVQADLDPAEVSLEDMEACAQLIAKYILSLKEEA